MFSCEICAIYKNTFIHRTSLVAAFVLKSKNEKIYSQENASDSALFSTVAVLKAYSFTKKDSISDVFCEICEVLQNLKFTKESWATASDFQQHLGHITCSVSNKWT